MDEVTINIRDLILKVILKWRLILVCMLIFGILFNGIGYVKKSLSVKNETNQQTVTVNMEEESSEQEIMHALNIYRLYQFNYENIHNYLANSIRMQIDPNQVPTYTIQYLIDNHYQTEYPVIEKKDTTKDIINSYMARLKSETVLKEISKELGYDGDISYIQELLDVAYTEPDILTITIISLSQKDCNTIASVILDQMGQFTAGLTEKYGNYDISLVNSEYTKRFSMDLLNERQNRIGTLDSINNSSKNLIKNLTDDQKKKFYELLENTVEENESINEIADEQTEQVPSEGAVKVHVSLLQKKYLLVGMIFGMLIAAFYVVCRYIFSGKTHVKGDITKYDIPVLGMMYLSEPAGIFSFIDRFILRIADSSRYKFSNEERKEMILSGINLISEKEQLKSVFITGTSNDRNCVQMQEEICENISVENTANGRSIIYDPEALSALALSEGVVLVEKFEDTTHKELYEELELCKRYDVKVLGCIIFA